MLGLPSSAGDREEDGLFAWYASELPVTRTKHPERVERWRCILFMIMALGVSPTLPHHCGLVLRWIIMAETVW